MRRSIPSQRAARPPPRQKNVRERLTSRSGPHLSAMHHKLSSFFFLAGIAFGTTACVETEDDLLDDDALGETEQAIEDGTEASAFQLARAADLVGCTGTRISPRHVLTALHCVCIRPFE